MKLTIGMMVKNESKYLAQCLESLQPIRDAIQSELIIVDTGSDDNTVEIARRYTDKVYLHPWNNNFSEMRNITISYATGEWFFNIDGDEIMQQTKGFIDFLKSKESKKYGAAFISIKNMTTELDENNYSVLLIPRLCRRDKKFHFAGAIHEQPVFNGKAIALEEADLVHYGYMATDKVLMDRKFIRTGTILKAELEKEPENIYYWFQLSVTYGMHKDFDESLEYALKAYQVLHMGKVEVARYMYVYTHLAFVYQTLKNFEKVEEICREALEIQKFKYVDIYYFLAESQIVLGKYGESIKYFEEYLDIVDNYSEYQKNKDNAVIDYTVGQPDNAYFNLFNSCQAIGEDDKALVYGAKVKSIEWVKGILPKYIALLIQAGRYDALRQYYEERIVGENEDLIGSFMEILEKCKSETKDSEIIKIARCFVDGNKDDAEDYYRLLSRVIVEEHAGEFSDETLEAVKHIDFSLLPMYCSGIFYYLIKGNYPLGTVLTNFKEIWIDCAFDYLAKQHDDLGARLYEYLKEHQSRETISEYKLSKALCRYVLLLDKLEDDKYSEVFNRYVNDGIYYLQLIYNQTIIEHELVNEVKNDEEVFLLYMYQAKKIINVDQAGYVKNLRRALETMPIMKKGIEMLLNMMLTEEGRLGNEMEDYKVQVKNTIKQLINDRQLNDASDLISEYKSIVPQDVEIILLESQLMLLIQGQMGK